MNINSKEQKGRTLTITRFLNASNASATASTYKNYMEKNTLVIIEVSD